MISSFSPSWKQTILGLSVIVEDILGNSKQWSPSVKWACFIKTQPEELDIIGLVLLSHNIIVQPKKIALLKKYKIDALYNLHYNYIYP
jgi:hypothetical protein